MILETQRLILRRLDWPDRAALCGILQDEQTMYAYEHAFSDAEVDEWLERQLERYERDGFGLWAVLRREDGVFVGQAGITAQDWDGARVPEIGYLFNRRAWHRGYASEAAVGCREYAFDTLGLDRVYSIIRSDNLPSRNVARRNGMHVVGQMVKHYYGMDMPHEVWSVSREEAERGAGA